MDKVIEQILDIDREAQQRIDDAQKQGVSLEEELQKEKETLLKQLADHSQEKLQTVYDTEHAYAKTKMEAIESHKRETLQKLNEEYENNHLKWEQALYERTLAK